jgi:cell division protein FtsI (penicillin-binding protein 3)
MAHVPLMNPGETHRARAITDAFEPGSTLKPFVIAAALQAGTLKPNRKIDCEGGRFEVGGHWITEAEKNHQFGVLTVSEVLAYSSNVGMAKIALELGAEKLRERLSAYGFGKITGIDFPGESRGILLPLPWRPHLLSNIGFGQGVSVTPLQIAEAYAMIASGGYWRRPLLVKSIQNSERGERTDFQPAAGLRVLSPTQASVLTYMLTSATSRQGTGFNARIPGFPVAGKTGTAQKVDLDHGGYKKNAYVSSFAGFVPAHDPRFVIYVAVDDPQNGYYGAQVAAPVFAKVAQFAVQKKGLAPVLIEDRHVILANQQKPSNDGEEAKQQPQMARGLVPQFVGLSLREVYQKAHGLPMTFEVVGSGLVARTSPEAGKSLPPSSRVQLILQRAQE